MQSKQKRCQAIPTNIITGFLGVGKTSAILHLLQAKPQHERWAVLVNEFGEIGVDGSLFAGGSANEKSVFIREVPGGCMCCASGLPMQVALNQLLSEARPDRLLIEPTGLGHPREVLQVLSSGYYRESLSLHKTLTLVDARKLSDARYLNNDTFKQQIRVADVVIANKLDLYEDDDKKRLVNYAQQIGYPTDELLYTTQAKIPFSALQGLSKTHADFSDHQHHHHHQSEVALAVTDQPIPDCGYIKAINKGEGFHSVGWRFSPDKVFQRQKLLLLLTGLSVERMKAVFITAEGIYGYNLTSDALTEMELDDCLESRIEIIAELIDDSLEAELLACIAN